MRSPRRVLALCVAAAAVFATAACGGGSPDPTDPTADPSPTAVLGEGPSGSPTSAPGGEPSGGASTPPPAPAYPSTPRAYAEAMLKAWGDGNISRLGQLATPLVQEQLIEIPGPINKNWHYNRCDGAAGSSYCVFFNDPGDMITLKISNSILGAAHAGTQVLFDQVSFPTDPVQYVKKFIGAWQEGNTYRMKILSNQTEVEYFTHYAPPEPGTEACYSGGAAGSQYVRVYNGDGLEYLLRLTTATLGHQHAISGHTDPSGSNCI